MPSVPQGLGAGRAAVPCRQGPQGGGRGGGWARGHEGRGRRQDVDDRGGGGRRAAAPLGQGRQRARRGRALGAAYREPPGPKDVPPLLGGALPHPAPAALDHWEGGGLQGGEEEAPRLCRGRPGAVLIASPLAGGPGVPIQAPRGHRRLERGRAGREKARQRGKGSAGTIQPLGRAGLQIGQPYTGHTGDLLAGEAQYTIIGINSSVWSIDAHQDERALTGQVHRHALLGVHFEHVVDGVVALHLS